MLGIAEGGIGGAQQLNGPAGAVFRGDQVDAVLLTPLMVVGSLVDQVQRGRAAVTGSLGFLFLRLLPDDGTGKGRRVHPHMIVGDDSLQPLAPDVHFHMILTLDGGVQVSQTDGALGGGLQDFGGQAGALMLEIGHHGAGGDPAHFLPVLIDRHAGADDTPVHQADRHDALGQRLDIAEIMVADALVGGGLELQRLAAHKVAFLLGKADGELGQGYGKDGDLLAAGIGTHLVPVQGQGSFQTQGIPGAQAGGLGAQLHQAVPQPGGILALYIDLIAQRLAGVAGLGHAGRMTFQRQRVQGVFYRFGEGLSAGEHLQHLAALGTLDGNGRPILGDVGDLHIVPLRQGQQVGQILFGVGGVDHQQIVVLLKPVEVGVVHGAAVFIGDDAVLGGVQIQRQHVAGQHILQESHTLRSFDQQTAHVGHVKQAAAAAGVKMLGHDAGGILHRHFPAAEIHHGGPCGHMDFVKLGALQFTHVFSSRSNH